MVDWRDECCDCQLPCLGNDCQKKNVPHLICDRCGEEDEALWEVDGEQVCESCLKSIFTMIRLEEL